MVRNSLVEAHRGGLLRAVGGAVALLLRCNTGRIGNRMSGPVERTGDGCPVAGSEGLPTGALQEAQRTAQVLVDVVGEELLNPMLRSGSDELFDPSIGMIDSQLREGSAQPTLPEGEAVRTRRERGLGNRGHVSSDRDEVADRLPPTRVGGSEEQLEGIEQGRLPTLVRPLDDGDAGRVERDLRSVDAAYVAQADPVEPHRPPPDARRCNNARASIATRVSPSPPVTRARNSSNAAAAGPDSPRSTASSGSGTTTRSVCRPHN